MDFARNCEETGQSYLISILSFYAGGLQGISLIIRFFFIEINEKIKYTGYKGLVISCPVVMINVTIRQPDKNLMDKVIWHGFLSVAARIRSGCRAG